VWTYDDQTCAQKFKTCTACRDQQLLWCREASSRSEYCYEFFGGVASNYGEQASCPGGSVSAASSCGSLGIGGSGTVGSSSGGFDIVLFLFVVIILGCLGCCGAAFLRSHCSGRRELRSGAHSQPVGFSLPANEFGIVLAIGGLFAAAERRDDSNDPGVIRAVASAQAAAKATIVTLTLPGGEPLGICHASEATSMDERSAFGNCRVIVRALSPLGAIERQGMRAPFGVVSVGREWLLTSSVETVVAACDDAASSSNGSGVVDMKVAIPPHVAKKKGEQSSIGGQPPLQHQQQLQLQQPAQQPMVRPLPNWL